MAEIAWKPERLALCAAGVFQSDLFDIAAHWQVCGTCSGLDDARLLAVEWYFKDKLGIGDDRPFDDVVIIEDRRVRRFQSPRAARGGRNARARSG